ncbi:hypothetical protein QIS99_06480 [Streptomyces sp. B-S-A8]|uniref:DUF4175 domain-containing protein n=1 Tax=Streptomyces solicavernae TaxID=3043614 RepID=A0ABT6RN52_9ACTN|nr:hypothetical protein [Streptomyces sp. B-S-A8]MDI3385865.1 hypothetical protein [Streptomyces sp. B-S-A8]
MSRALRVMAGPIGGVLTGGLGAGLLGWAWRTCDIGINGAANSFSLALVFLALTAVATLWWWFAPARFGVAGPAIAVLGSLLLVWGVLAWLHAPDGYPAPFCPPGNVPPWWPELLPL